MTDFGALPIRRFTSLGLSEFRSYLSQGKVTDEPPPEHLLASDKHSEPVFGKADAGCLSVRSFEQKFDLGMHVIQALGSKRTHQILGDPYVWPWLSLYFAPSTFPQKNGQYRIDASSRHVIEKISGRNQDLMHRHLVRGGVVAVLRFGQHAKALLGRPDEQTKSEEEVMSRTIDLGLSASPEFVKLIETIYWDAKKGKLRSGAKGEGPGSIKRLVRNMRQLDVTYDIPSLDAMEIKSLLLPTEFQT